MAELATAAPDSLQQENGDGLTLESTLADSGSEEAMVERIALRSAIDRLPEQEKKTILLRFYKGLTQQQCARILSVSQVQVSRLEKRALEKLRREMDSIKGWGPPIPLSVYCLPFQRAEMMDLTDRTGDFRQ